MLGYHDWPFLTYTYGRQRISEKQLSGSTWTLTFYGCGGHGNVRFTTNTAGTVGNTYRYDAFGMPIASTGTIANTYLYSGERFDSNLNLYHLRARYYNMLAGRFETMDPAAGKIFAPRTLHRYVYTGNNPVNAIDPTGEDAILESLVTIAKSTEFNLYIIGANASWLVGHYIDPKGFQTWSHVSIGCDIATGLGVVGGILALQ